MEKFIACCGINCALCNARIATVTDDNELRARQADEWRVLYNSPEITPEMINCTGCRQEGAKIGYCEHCEMRNCVLSMNYRTCGECERLENCPVLNKVIQYAPEVLENLKSLN